MSIFSVSLSLRSETLSLEDLTVYAGSEPTRSHKRGDRISPRMPATKVRRESLWMVDSGVALDSWTLEAHWLVLESILATIATRPNPGVAATLSIGTNARGSGFAFDVSLEQVALLARAECGLWIDSYEANRDREDRPDDYPYPDGGTLRRPNLLRRLRRRVNLLIRTVNPFGKVRKHRNKTQVNSTEALG